MKVFAVHLIHRGAVPLPLEGKDNAPLKMRLDCKCRAFRAIADLIHRGAVPLPHKARLRTSYEEKALTRPIGGA